VVALSEARLEDHVPGGYDEEKKDRAHCPRPPAQLARRLGLVAGVGSSLSSDRGAEQILIGGAFR